MENFIFTNETNKENVSLSIEETAKILFNKLDAHFIYSIYIEIIYREKDEMSPHSDYFLAIVNDVPEKKYLIFPFDKEYIQNLNEIQISEAIRFE